MRCSVWLVLDSLSFLDKLFELFFKGSELLIDEAQFTLDLVEVACDSGDVGHNLRGCLTVNPVHLFEWLCLVYCTSGAS